MSEKIDCGSCEAKMIIESQNRFIQQLLDIRDIRLHPLVKVRTATEDDYRRLWNVKEALLKKYQQIVKAFQRLTPGLEVPTIEKTVFVDTVRMILGDDVNVKRVTEDEVERC